MKTNYLTLSIKTFSGIAALWLSENVCKPLILGSRGYKAVKYTSRKSFVRPGEWPLAREFAVERAEKELRLIKEAP